MEGRCNLEKKERAKIEIEKKKYRNQIYNITKNN